MFHFLLPRAILWVAYHVMETDISYDGERNKDWASETTWEGGGAAFSAGMIFCAAKASDFTFLFQIVTTTIRKVTIQ